VASNLNEYYNGIKTGVFEGTLTFMTAAAAIKVHEVAPYICMVNFGSQFAGGLSINKDVFESFPPEVQKIFLEVGKEYDKKLAEAQAARASKSIEMMKQAGAKVIYLSDAERTRWANKLPNVPMGWVNSMDKKGLPGKAHSMLLEDLLPDTLYHFKIICTDLFGQSVESEVSSFRTLPNTATAVQQDGEVPDQFRLSPSYPNPFNGRTCMEVAIPHSGHMLAVVYNLSGQEVTCLYDKMISAGTRNITWDGVNQHGRQVSSGVYILRIVYQGESGETKTSFNKLILNR